MPLYRRQQIALERFLEGKNLFITGSAGTGKSLLLKHLIDAYKGNPKDMVLTSTTGISSLNIGGRTIHSWSGVRPHTDLEDTEGFVSQLKRNQSLLNQWLYTKVLVIDEISMLSPQMLDGLEKVARHVRGNDSVFGGIQIVATGDFFQLPPVYESQDDSLFAFEAECWKSLIDNTIVLDQVHRQTDPSFIDFLNRVRMGKRPRLEHIQCYLENPHYTKDYTHLFANRLYVETHNLKRLEELPGPLTNHVAQLTSKTKTKTPLPFPKDTCIPEKLVLKPNAFVIINKNIDFEKGLVNGRQAYYRGMLNQQMILETLDGTSHYVSKTTWEFPHYNIEQYPVCLAWALTIHKSQGMGISHLSVDIGKNIFNPGQTYVALSRATQGQHLHISRYDPQSIQSHSKVIAFYQRLDKNQNKYFRNQKEGFQNKLTGEIVLTLPPNSKLIKTPCLKNTPPTTPISIIANNKVCSHCHREPYLMDYFEFLDEKICQTCMRQDRNYRLLSKTHLVQELEISKSKLEKVLKTLFYKPQANTVNPRFAPTRLYLLKHVNEALQTPPSPKPIDTQKSLQTTHTGPNEVISIRKSNLNHLGYPSLMDWLRNDNHIYIGRNMTVYVPGALQSKWNNPFTVKKYGIEKSLQLYREWVMTGIHPINGKKRKEGPLLNEIEELRGKILGCWCKPNKCHGDVLIDIINDNSSVL